MRYLSYLESGGGKYISGSRKYAGGPITELITATGSCTNTECLTVKFRLVWDYNAMLRCLLGAQTLSSSSNAVAFPLGTDDQTWEQALHYIEHVLGVTPLPPDLWEDTNEWHRLKSACQADHDEIESLLHRWFIRLPPPDNHRFECRVPVNDDRTNYCGATMHKKWRILSHIRTHLQYRPFACDGQCGSTGWYGSSLNSIVHLLNLFHYSQYGATNEQQLRLHINPDVRECQKWCEYLTSLSQCLG